MPEQESRRHLTTIGSIILVFILLIVIVSVWQRSAKESQGMPESLVVPEVTNMDSRQIAENLPKELVLNEETEIIGSYTATYPNSSAKQTSVEFNSSDSPETNFDFYTQWATDNRWAVANSSKGAQVSSLYLKKETEQMSIVISASKNVAGGSSIVISHVNLNK